MTHSKNAAPVAMPEPAATPAAAAVPQVPAYLREVYSWAYLNRVGQLVFDNPLAVNAILWGNMTPLTNAVLAELKPGQTVLQPACVYGNFSRRVAERLGPDGRLDLMDIAPIQVANARRKLKGLGQVRIKRADAAARGGSEYDAVACFFLLHEVPEDYKAAIVDALLARVAPGGKAVFVDYHRPRALHPLKPLMSLVFDTLEPFAKGLWNKEIADYAPAAAAAFDWRKTTRFASLYQVVVAERTH